MLPPFRLPLDFAITLSMLFFSALPLLLPRRVTLSPRAATYDMPCYAAYAYVDADAAAAMLPPRATLPPVMPLMLFFALLIFHFRHAAACFHATYAPLLSLFAAASLRRRFR